MSSLMSALMSRDKSNLRNLWLTAGVFASLTAPSLWAQYPPAPTTYDVIQVGGMTGNMHIYRDGSKVVIDHPENHSRSLYDLSAHTNYSWSPEQPGNGCSSGRFSGDWGDPFESADVNEIVKSATKPPTSETLNGFATKVYEAIDPESKSKIKVWREPKYGLVIKVEMTPPGGATTIMEETKQFSLAKPSAALFTLPAGCGPPPPPRKNASPPKPAIARGVSPTPPIGPALPIPAPC